MIDNEHIRYQGIRQEQSMTTYYVSMSNGELLIDREFFDLGSHDSSGQ